MNIRNHISFILFICFICFSAFQYSCAQTKTNYEQTLSGKVIHITDGDTYIILLDQNEQKTIRMEGIDAPEKGQDFSRKASDYLKSLILGKIVTIKFTETDQYGRFIALTYLENGTEISHEMIKNGWAWHFKKYNQDKDLSDLESEAKKKGLGLWADQYAIEPWIERKMRKKGYKSTEIKQLKINGILTDEQSIQYIPYKEKQSSPENNSSSK
ncbi:MAG: thermonuclease family protein [Paludibacteraceae bacterium]|nr:thermonuclease family protein [Paludibacteraceae bacterium]